MALNGYTGSVFWNPNMDTYIGKETEILRRKNADTTWKCEGNDWNWCEEWLEPVGLDLDEFRSGLASYCSAGTSPITSTLLSASSIMSYPNNPNMFYHIPSTIDFPLSTLSFINNKKERKKMSLREKFTLALTPEPQKSFRKAGITNGDDLLTNEGQEVFLSWLLQTKFADEFKTAVVDDILKEKKKEETN